MKAPGETDILVSGVTLQAKDGGDLAVDHGVLMDRLGMRKGSLILPARYYSAFREVEDQRRITAFWENSGYFDAKVEPPVVERDPEAGEESVTITWNITEGMRYAVADIQLKSAPEEHEAALEELIFFETGTTEIDLEKYRYVRRDMASHLRRAGYGHARVYSRVFVDEREKHIHWFYYVDAGPKTKIGKIVVEGNAKTPPDIVIERSGLVSGEPYDWNKRFDGEFHILDTGAYSSTFIRADVDTKFHVPGDAPDTGGEISDDRIDEDGDLIPRELPETVDIKIHVVEAPSQQLRVRAGAELDPNRFDTALTSRLWLRNLFGPWHHLVLEGRVGFGALYRSTTDDPTGIYGEALIRYIKPKFLTRLLDFRLSARFRDVLYPGFHLRELTAGPGLRVAIAPGRNPKFYGGGFFFDTDVLFRLGQQVDFGPFDPPVRDQFNLTDEELYLGGELQASLVWDARDNPLEALKGHLLALRGGLSPGGVDKWNRYVSVSPEARLFLPVSDSFSFGLRGLGSWVLAHDDTGVPLGPRLFGGGSYSFRGFGRDQLSPKAPACQRNAAGSLLVCQNTPVGGLSLAEAALEARFLPPLAPYGIVVFGDLAGAGADANPFEDGVNVAAGLGLRLRFWYLPAAFDFSYRILGNSEVQELADEPFGVFFRLGEAF